MFFINSDGTYSSATLDNAPLENLSFTSLPDGRLTMNSSLGELVKETDGTLTGRGQNYQYLGNLTKEQFLQQKDEGNSTSSPEVPQAIESAQEPLYVTFEKEDSGPTQFAEKHGITLQQLFELNGLSLDSVLYPGQSLRIK